MLEETEESCGHENLGEYINQFRHLLFWRISLFLD